MKETSSDSSYATIESVQIEATESTKLPSNRTVLTYSAKNHTLFVSNDTPTNGKSMDLHYFTYENNIAKIKYLLENIKRNNNPTNVREVISQKDKHDNTPLHIACMLGNLEICKLLCDAGAVVKTRNRMMWTPLNEAISYGNRELGKFSYEARIEKIVLYFFLHSTN